MPKRSPSSSPSASTSTLASSPTKKARKRSPSATSNTSSENDAFEDVLGKGKWKDWPAPMDQIEGAREFFQECARNKHLTVLVPDKDADGLSSGMIAYKTLRTLGLPSKRIKIHFLAKGNSLFSPAEQERMEKTVNDGLSEVLEEKETREARIIVLDQGSRPGPPLVRESATNASLKTLIVDHHMSDSFPSESIVLSACRSHPICTTSLLVYLTCKTLHQDLKSLTMWYAILGVFGDLSPSEINWGKKGAEWPASREMVELGEEVKRIGKSGLSKAVGALNAPRRTAEYNVSDAWDVLFKAETPAQITSSDVLQDARDAVNREVERCTHTAPKFSKDGRVALLRINSGYQVHPVIATRWSGTLKAKNLQMIMVENPGHNPDPLLTSFSCRIPSSVRKLPSSEQPNLIALLREFGELTSPDFLERVGNDFARGHKEATGGIIKKADFEEFAEKGMEIGVKDPNKPLTKKEKEEKELKSNKSLKSFFAVTPTKKKDAKAEESPKKEEAKVEA